MMSPPDIRISNLLTCPQVKMVPAEFTFSGVGDDLFLAWQDEPLSGLDYLMDLDGSITICLSTFLTKLDKNNQRRTSAEVVCSMVFLPISLVLLLGCLVVYVIFPALRALAGKNNMLLVASLTLTQMSMWIGYMVPYHSAWCTAMGLMCHYFSLCLFLSLVLCSYHLYKVFSTMHLSVDITKEHRTFILYCCCIFLTPILVISAVIIVSKSSDPLHTSTGYGSGALCFLTSKTAVWLSLFLPLIVLVAVALMLFLLTYSALQSNADVETNVTDERHVHFYFRTSIIVALVWTLGTIALQTALSELRVVFILTQFGLGLYVFVTLVINRRIAALVTASCFSKTDREKNATSLRLNRIKSKDMSASQPSVVATGYKQRDSPKSYGNRSRDSLEFYLDDDCDDKSRISNDDYNYNTMETIA